MRSVKERYFCSKEILTLTREKTYCKRTSKALCSMDLKHGLW